MTSAAAGPMLLHNTMRITDGHLEDYKEAVRRAVEFVEQHGPQLMVQVFIDEDRMLAHSFQLHPDTDALLQHQRLSQEYIDDVMRHCTVERLEIYGGPAADPDAEPLPVRSPDGQTRTTPLTGFVRSAAHGAAGTEA